MRAHLDTHGKVVLGKAGVDAAVDGAALVLDVQQHPEPVVDERDVP